MVLFLCSCVLLFFCSSVLLFFRFVLRPLQFQCHPDHVSDVILSEGGLPRAASFWFRCHPERGRAPARFLQRGKPESKDPFRYHYPVPTITACRPTPMRISPPMPRSYEFFVYILSSLSGTLYIGITDDIHKRVWQHKHKRFQGFTCDHDVDRLLYFEQFVDVRNAIAREKQLKGWRREKKIKLLEKTNPRWEDLSNNWFNVT
jgi:putative endonuclease